MNHRAPESPGSGGYLTRNELARVCRWKAGRVLPLIRSSNHHRVRAATAAAFATRNEVARMEALTELRGIGIPMASAILTLTEPRRYGVIDIRAWQLLYRRGLVAENPRGTKFTVGQWCTFLALIRRVARELRVSARTVERTLYELDQRERPVLGLGHG